MEAVVQSIFGFLGVANEILWGPWAFVVLVAAGLLFTVWTRLVQVRALTHGVAVIRGDYDEEGDPGAINHFQALSAALSGTVGLGNIGGVALAIGLGGPGALFWMWVIGFLGMALKTVEITLAMMYRNTDDPKNPSGGAMWVIDKTLGRQGGWKKTVGKLLGGFFCVTLMVSSISGGNMFQAWNVADLSNLYFGVPQIATGIGLAVLVGLVILGGIQRIGSVAGKLVPMMCILYVVAAIAVLALHVTEIPAMLALIVESAFTDTQAVGAFLGGTVGSAFTVGVQRALFSNEAGQGSAPIAHTAVKTSEPAREGVVGGLEPFIDTLVICTLTALVIIATGTWQRDAVGPMQGEPPRLEAAAEPGALRLVAPTQADALPELPAWEAWYPGAQVFFLVSVPASPDHDLLAATDDALTQAGLPPDRLPALRALASPDRPAPTWAEVEAALTPDHAARLRQAGLSLDRDRSRIMGRIQGAQERGGDTIAWEAPPAGARWLPEAPDAPQRHIFRDFKGATLTSHAFDLAFPGLGKWLVTLASWLFALSTIISWCYYGEQGVVYLLGKRAVLPYKALFLLATVIAPVAVTTDAELGNLADFGTGFMLWANMPIVLVMGFLAVRELDSYFARLKRGDFARRGVDKK